MLEKMSDFFENRLTGYDEHMLSNIYGAKEFYAYTASLLPTAADAEILDLGCGTGLELEEYFAVNPNARVTGIDLSASMLRKLSSKFENRSIRLICGSYFDVPLGTGEYDAVVSVESLHHFTKEQKRKLYSKLKKSLKPDGYFVLTDYFAGSDELESEYFAQLEALKKEQGITDDEFYHYDTPLTVEHEIEILKESGFTGTEIKKNWQATYTIVAAF